MFILNKKRYSQQNIATWYEFFCNRKDPILEYNFKTDEASLFSNSGSV